MRARGFFALLINKIKITLNTFLKGARIQTHISLI